MTSLRPIYVLSAGTRRVHYMRGFENIPDARSLFLSYSSGGLHAVHKHSRALGGGHELPSSPAVRLHQAVSGRLLRREYRRAAAGEIPRLTEP